MTEKSKYIAVTIGPVFDTINLASTPCALWAGSYMLSMLSKNICTTLTTEEFGIQQADIISPSFSPNSTIIQRNDGVGLFHDRVIFKIDETKFTIEDFSKVKQKAIEKTVKDFGFEDKWLDYFKKYFLVSAVEFESVYVKEDKDKKIKAHNPILDSSVALDCLELVKPFQKQEGTNPLLDIYTPDNGKNNDQTKETSKNREIKKRVQAMGIQNWQLYSKKSDKRIKDLEELSSGKIDEELKKKFKKYSYYAVVRSDGDRMGKIISSLSSDEEVRKFSSTCFAYCSDIADMVYSQYDGISIYAGGDDLLALIPIETKDRKTVFNFVQDANEKFNEHFKNYKEAGASLSFGIFVSYYKFPLYEALEQSAYLLFGVAKTERNAVAIHFQKHSGQSAGLLIDNGSMGNFIDFYSKVYPKAEKNIEEKEKIFLSAMHKLVLFEAMFNAQNADEEIIQLFKNTFDADEHKGNQFLGSILPEFFIELRKDIQIFPITDNGVKLFKDTDEKRHNKNFVATMVYILRVIKFFSESAGE